MRQLSLWSRARATLGRVPPEPPRPDPNDTRPLAAWLGRAIGRPVRLTFTNNRSTMMSSREDDSGLRLRLHRMFVGAPAEVWWALVGYIAHDDRDAGVVLDRFIETHTPVEPMPRAQLRPIGRHHDLAEIRDELNQRFFHEAVNVDITWGSAGSRRYRRSIMLGSYVRAERLIRIHPCLDQAFVPRFYVAWVVFHEMLHEVFGVEGHRKRRSLHPPEFVAVEESYPDFVACKRWEEDNLPRLLRYSPPARSRR